MFREIDKIVQVCNTEKELDPSELRKMMATMALSFKSLAESKLELKDQTSATQIFATKCEMEKSIEALAMRSVQISERISIIENKLSRIDSLPKNDSIYAKLNQEALYDKNFILSSQQQLEKKIKAVQDQVKKAKQNISDKLLKDAQIHLKHEEIFKTLQSKIVQIIKKIRKIQTRSQSQSCLLKLANKIKLWRPNYANLKQAEEIEQKIQEVDDEKNQKNIQLPNISSWLDPLCFYASEFHFEEDRIQCKSKGFLFSRDVIRDVYKFDVHILYDKYLGIGVIDSSYKNIYLNGDISRVDSLPNMIIYLRKEHKYDRFVTIIGKERISSKKDFRKGQTMIVTIDIQNSFIEWKVGNQIRNRLKAPILSRQNVIWVPFVYFGEQKAAIKLSRLN